MSGFTNNLPTTGELLSDQFKASSPQKNTSLHAFAETKCLGGKHINLHWL